MQDRVTYEFTVIRLVPKVEREEFINIGVILFSKPKRFLEMRFVIDEQKVRAFCKDIDTDAIHQYLKAWELVCKGKSDSGRIGEMDIASRFRWLTASRSTIIQSSKTHPGLCHHPEKILDELFELYVL